jgi:hypothetical protein
MKYEAGKFNKEVWDCPASIDTSLSKMDFAR